MKTCPVPYFSSNNSSRVPMPNVCKYFILALVVFSISACQIREPNPAYLSIPIEIKAGDRLTNIIDSFEFVPLISSSLNFPAQVDKTAVLSDFVVVLDREILKSVFVYRLSDGVEVATGLDFGEGPDELSAISDFSTLGDTLLVLDEVRRLVVHLVFSKEKGRFEVAKSTKIPFSANRLAVDQGFFWFLTSGDSQDVVLVTDEYFNRLDSFFKRDITHLKKPLNSFHKGSEDGKGILLFHSLFDNIVYRMDRDKLVKWRLLKFSDLEINLQPEKEYVLDLEGLNKYFQSLTQLPSHFTIFEYTGNSFLLLYFLSEKPVIVFGGDDGIVGYDLNSIDNDVSFEQLIPKITGVHDEFLLSVFSLDEINLGHEKYVTSELARSIKENPHAMMYLLKIKV